MDSEVRQKLDTLYQEKDYQGFVDLLGQNEKTMDEVLFHYNMGTAYLKMENWAPGRYHLEKARQLGPLDTRIQRNLTATREYLALSDIDSSPRFLEKSVNFLVGFDLQHFVFISLLSLLCLLLIWRKWMGRSLVILPLLILLSLGPTLPYFLLDNHVAAIVMEAVPLREGPSEAFEEISPRLSVGSKVILGRQDGPWRLITYPVTLSGWVRGESLRLL